MRAFATVLVVAAACDHTPRAPVGPTPADLAAALGQIERADDSARNDVAIAAATRLCGAICPCLHDPSTPCGDSGDPAFDRLDAAARYLAMAVDRATPAERPALAEQLAALSFTVGGLAAPLATTSKALRPIALDATIVVIGADGAASVEELPRYAIGPTGLRRVVVPHPAAPAPVVAMGLESVGRGGGGGGDSERAFARKEMVEEDMLEEGGEFLGDPSVIEFSDVDFDLPEAKAAPAWRVTEADFGATRGAAEPIIAIAPTAPVTSAVWALADRGGSLAVIAGGAPAELAARFGVPRARPDLVAATVVIVGREMSVSRRFEPRLAWTGARDPVALAKVLEGVPLGADSTVEIYLRNVTAADMLRALDALTARGPRWVRIAAPMP